MALLSVLTPTVPGRESLFNECRTSVWAQTRWGRIEHVVEIDAEQHGCAAVTNRLAARARGDFLIPLNDDDLMLPGCLASLRPLARPNRIIYPRPLVWGEPDDAYRGTPPDIPCTALIPRKVWEDLGGYDERLREREDNDLWVRALAAGVEFVPYDDSPTWVYRFWGGNKSRNGGVAS